MISKSIGFSQNTALFAFTDVVINCMWVGVADAIKTASISEFLIASSGEFTDCAPVSSETWLENS